MNIAQVVLLILCTVHGHVSLSRFRVTGAYDTDSSAFTQGLAFDGDEFVHSTGLRGESSVRRLRLENGSVQIYQMHRLPRYVFGEGVTVLGSSIFQLTYENGFAYEYDKSTLKQIAKHEYPASIAEGWGIASDTENGLLFVTDGTSRIHVLTRAFSEFGYVEVADEHGSPITGLNELELIPDKGELYINVYGSDCVARVDPSSGRLLGWIFGDHLHPHDGDNVFNGIAHHAKQRRLFVTGKRWPKLFEVSVEEDPSADVSRCLRDVRT